MGRIVVGVDGSAGARAALRWAMEEADLRGTSVEAVFAWHMPYMGGATLVPLSGVSLDPAEFEESYRAHLDTIVDEATSDLVDADAAAVERRLIYGPAATTLLDAAEGAELLVVGSRGMGGFKGLVLGSVTHQVIGNAPCATVVIPPPEDAA